jgi:hypothetical protein
MISLTVQRIVLGGSHFMTADANLVDASTGATIVAYQKLVASTMAGQGLTGAAVEAAIGSHASERWSSIMPMVTGPGCSRNPWAVVLAGPARTGPVRGRALQPLTCRPDLPIRTKRLI